MGRSKKKKKGADKAAQPARRDNDLAMAAGLTVLAFVHRLFFLFSNRDRSWPYTIFYEGDGETFFLHARAMLSGELYDNGVPFHPPGFSAFLAGLHTLLGAGDGAQEFPHLAVKISLALVGSLAVGLLYLLARPYIGRPAAIAAALLGVYHFGLYILSIATVSEGLYTTLLLSVLLIWSRCLDHPLTAPGHGTDGLSTAKALGSALILGLLLGSMALVRAEGGLVAFGLVATGLIGLALRWRRASREDEEKPAFSALQPWIVICIAWVLVVAPWTAGNAKRLGDLNERMSEQLAEPLPTFVPVTIYGPLNLALANYEGADGTFSPQAMKTLTGVDGLRFEYAPHLNLLLHGDKVAWEWIRENPGDFMGLALRRSWLHLDILRLGFTQWNIPGGLVGVRRPVDMFIPDAAWLKPVLLLLLLAGLALCARGNEERRQWAVLVTMISAMGFLTTFFFYGYARQGGLYLHLWLSLVGVTLWWGIETAQARLGNRLSTRRIRYAVVVLATVLLIVEGSGAGADRNYQASGDTIDGTIINRDDRVRLEVLP